MKKVSAWSKRNSVLPVVALILLSITGSEGRIWTDIKGRTLKGAEIITHDEVEVTFRLKGGRRYKMPVVRLSLKDREYLAKATPGDYPEDGVEEAENTDSDSAAVADEDEEALNWDDDWPERVSLEEPPSIEVVVEDKEKRRFVYESDHYRFTCNVRLNRSVVSNFSSLFEATRLYCRALPLAITGGFKSRGKYDIFLYETKEQYVQAGGPPTSAGVFMSRGDSSKILVPLTSLGVRKVGSGYMRDRDKSNGTLVHEITHQLTPRAYYTKGASGWFSEGLAEYITATPFSSRRFKVKGNFDDIVDYATAYGKDGTRGRALGKEFSAPALVDFFTMPYSEFTGASANFNYGFGLILTAYLFHLDGEGDAKRAKEFLKALRDPKVARAQKKSLATAGEAGKLARIGPRGRHSLKVLLNGSSFAEFQDEIVKSWRRKGVDIKFREPR